MKAYLEKRAARMRERAWLKAKRVAAVKRRESKKAKLLFSSDWISAYTLDIGRKQHFPRRVPKPVIHSKLPLKLFGGPVRRIRLQYAAEQRSPHATWNGLQWENAAIQFDALRSDRSAGSQAMAESAA